MQSNSLAKSALLAVILTVVVIGLWEFHLRGQGIKPDYDDDAELWANKRAMIYQPANKTTVILGSSRGVFDIDIPTYEHMTGKQVVQLSMVGSTPRTVFDDLANDPDFKGKLIFDVTETLFFNNAPFILTTPTENLNYYKKETPAQKVSFALDAPIEANFVFLNQYYFSINPLLDQLHISDRPGIRPGLDFPLDFGVTDFDRQNRMTDRFLADTSLQNRVRGIWLMLNGVLPPSITGKALADNLQNVKDDVDKIRKRGGDVIFLRTPSSGPIAGIEAKLFPKTLYWDKLLEITGCKGIYYTDYPAISHFVCPEFSHLQPSDAVIYTKNIVTILKNEKGWN
jgi:hypothetical protein